MSSSPVFIEVIYSMEVLPCDRHALFEEKKEADGKMLLIYTSVLVHRILRLKTIEQSPIGSNVKKHIPSYI